MKTTHLLRGRRGEEGFLLMTSYLLISVLSVFSIAFLTRGTYFLQASERNQNRIVAFNMAEAAVDEAIAQLTEDETYAGVDGFADLSSDQVQGGYQVTVTTPPGSANVRMIQAVGSSPSDVETERGHETRTITTYVQFGETNMFDFAVFAKESIQINGTPLVDSYDSRDGDYGGSNVGQNGDLGTDSAVADTVDMIGGANVQGDIQVGPDGNPILGEADSVVSMGTGSFLAGTVTAAEEPRDYEPESTSIASSGALSLSGKSTLTLSGGTYRYDSISITGQAQLSFSGPATLYVDGSVSIGGSGVATSSNDPPNLLIFVTGSGSVSVGGNADFYGAVYAPDSKVSLNGGAKPTNPTDFYGAFVGDELHQSGHMNIHYDEALEDAGTTGGGEVTVLSWREDHTVLGG